MSIDVLVGRHVEIDENKGAVGTLEMKRAWSEEVLNGKSQDSSPTRRLDYYKDTEQEGEKLKELCRDGTNNFSKEKKGTRGESLIPLSRNPSAIILSSFDTSLTRCLPAGRDSSLVTIASFIFSLGSKPI